MPIAILPLLVNVSFIDCLVCLVILRLFVLDCLFALFGNDCLFGFGQVVQMLMKTNKSFLKGVELSLTFLLFILSGNLILFIFM
jgi:hypothetical protein